MFAQSSVGLFQNFEKLQILTAMHQTSTLLLGDFRQVFRDRTLTMFIFLPFILIAAVRFLVPFLAIKFPILADYYPVIMMFASLQTAIMFGFITSFIILDEKDENVLQAIRVLPISSFYFILYRLSFATLFSSLGAFLMISLSGISYPGLINAVLLSILYGLTAPFITLLIATFASNKMEGMAYFKGLDLILILPVLVFFLDEKWTYVFAFIPTYWSNMLYHESVNEGPAVEVFLVAIVFYAALLYGLFHLFKRRVFDR